MFKVQPRRELSPLRRKLLYLLQYRPNTSSNVNLTGLAAVSCKHVGWCASLTGDGVGPRGPHAVRGPCNAACTFNFLFVDSSVHNLHLKLTIKKEQMVKHPENSQKVTHVCLQALFVRSGSTNPRPVPCSEITGIRMLA